MATEPTEQERIMSGRCIDLSHPSNKACEDCGTIFGVRFFPDPECHGVHACHLCGACSNWTPTRNANAITLPNPATGVSERPLGQAR